MENKYLKIISFFVHNHLVMQQLREEFITLSANPSNYLKNSSRMLAKTDDCLWLGLIDLLIKHGFAFEIDWKEDYVTAQELSNKLFLKNNLDYEIELDLKEDTEPNVFFALVNSALEKQGNYRIYSLDINSDSYISALGKSSTLLDVKTLDERIMVY